MVVGPPSPGVSTPPSAIIPVPLSTTVTDVTEYVVEVIREHVEPREITRGSSFVDIVEPAGTLLNVGAGPVLPENPYEGQVWILT